MQNAYTTSITHCVIMSDCTLDCLDLIHSLRGMLSRDNSDGHYVHMWKGYSKSKAHVCAGILVMRGAFCVRHLYSKQLTP